MEPRINRKTPDDVPEKGCAHTLTQTVCHNFRNLTIIQKAVRLGSSSVLALDNMFMLGLRGKEKGKTNTQPVSVHKGS